MLGSKNIQMKIYSLILSYVQNILYTWMHIFLQQHLKCGYQAKILQRQDILQFSAPKW